MRLLDALLDLLPRNVGLTLKRTFGPRVYHDNRVNRFRDTFESLGLDEADVARLHAQFLKIDKDGSGSLELWEMLDHLDLHRTKFAKRVFSIFDEDGSNEIDFREFVVTLWQRGAGARRARFDARRDPRNARRASRARTSLVPR